MQHSLETNRAFPYIAWAVFICFAFFTFYLTIQLQDTAEQLAQKSTARAESVEATQ